MSFRRLATSVDTAEVHEVRLDERHQADVEAPVREVDVLVGLSVDFHAKGVEASSLEASCGF